MAKTETISPEFYGTASIRHILFRVAPPVMLAQLIQALYNIVDSFFVGMYSNDALTALTVIYPLQLVIIALAVGTGVGVNTYMAREYALKEDKKAEDAAGTGTLLALLSWVLLSVLALLLMRTYVLSSASEPGAIEHAVVYGNIVCIGSLGTLFEGCWSKVHQARGNMRRPMVAQVVGALTNVVFDPLLIFGIGPFPALGVVGAAFATVLGQFVSAAIVLPGGLCCPPGIKRLFYFAKRIYHYGYSSIFMQMLYTVYIVMLNMILVGFSDAAVTVLGLYYKWQSFFFIPLFGLQTCIVPVLSFNATRKLYRRCRQTMQCTYFISVVFMALGTVCFVFFPEALIRLFSHSDEVLAIGKIAFRIIGCGFFSAVFALIMPTFFQAIGQGVPSVALSLIRQILLLVPLFWLFAQLGLNYSWLAFPIAETVSGGIGLWLYFKQLKKWNLFDKATHNNKGIIS